MTSRPAARDASWLGAVRRSLSAAHAVDDLFVVAAIEARDRCGFGRAVVLDVADGVLRADITGTLSHPESERLHRQVIGSPITLPPGSLEATLIRGAPPARYDASAVEAALGLETPAIVAIVPEHVPVALLVADQPEDDDSTERLEVLAHFVASALVSLVLRMRIDELATEMRYLTASAHGLLHEAQNAPICLPRDHGQGLAFAHAGAKQHRRDEEDDGLLTLREREIMELVVAGRSNSEIAAELHISADTAKTYIGRIFRKLGAANRVGAVVAYLDRRTRKAA